MALKISKVQVWAGQIADEPGGVGKVLGALADAGASLECVIARRQPDKPGTGVVFLTPVRGKKQHEAARAAGLAPAEHIGTLRVEGPDKPGAGSRIARAIAEAGVSGRGVSALALGTKFVVYLGFDSAEDADKAAKAIKAMEAKAKK